MTKLIGFQAAFMKLSLIGLLMGACVFFLYRTLIDFKIAAMLDFEAEREALETFCRMFAFFNFDSPSSLLPI